MKILIFIIGFILGGAAGIVCMCIVQINRYTENEMLKFNNKKEK